jgi:hypothetical protein
MIRTNSATVSFANVYRFLYSLATGDVPYGVLPFRIQMRDVSFTWRCLNEAKV